MDNFGKGMDAKGNNLLAIFEERMHAFIDLYKQTKAENETLKKTLEDKDNKLQETQQAFESLQAKYKNLRTARIAAETDDRTFQEAKAQIDKLVREIDACIELLNE